MKSPPITLAQVRLLLAEVSAPENVAGVRQLGGGESGAAHLVTFIDGSQPLVVKVYPADGGGWALAHEVAAYRLLGRNGIRQMPKLIAGARSGDSPLGRPYLVMTKLERMSLERYAETATDDEIAVAYQQLGSLLRRIHSIPQVGFGRHLTQAGNRDLTNRAFWQGVFEAQVDAFARDSGDDETVEKAREYVSDRIGLFELCHSPMLLHGDLHEGNAIVDTIDGRPILTGIVDLESAMAGDPVADLARLDAFSMHGSDLKQRALFNGYGSTPTQWEGRKRLYQLVQAFELWGWYRRDDQDERLPGVRERISALLALG